MSTLHLNLTKKWFDMILSGKKQVEYRALTFYWANRLFDIDSKQIQEFNLKEGFKSNPYANAIFVRMHYQPKPFKTITFSNGMKPIEHLRRFEILIHSLKIDIGFEDLGAERDEFYFCFYLGEIVHKHNC